MPTQFKPHFMLKDPKSGAWAEDKDITLEKPYVPQVGDLIAMGNKDTEESFNIQVVKRLFSLVDDSVYLFVTK